MARVLFDIAGRVPQTLTTELAQWADVVVTMGCGDECPYIPGRRAIDWELEDPAAQGPDKVRDIRDDIERRVYDLIEELAAAAH
jgi:arsenate reductase